MEATGHRVAAVTWLLREDPGQTGQQNQCCSQEEAEEGGGERGGSPAAAGGHTGNTGGEGGGVSVWFTCPGSLKELSATLRKPLGIKETCSLSCFM